MPARPHCMWVLGVVTLVTLAPLHAGPVRTGFDTETLPHLDDGSSGPVAVGFGLTFYGTTHRDLYVNENGNVTFGAPLGAFTPVRLGQMRNPVFAPFFADVDAYAAGSVTYGTGTVGGRAAFAATWSDVGYYNKRSDKLNDFQVVLIDRPDTGAGNFDAEFNYGRVEWEAGDFSGGVRGLGGSTARAGFSDGAGSAFELTGSGVPGALLDTGPPGTALARNLLRGDVTGRYVFLFRDGAPDGLPVGGGEPTPPPSAPVSGVVGTPEPGTALLAAVGLAAAGMGVRRPRRVTARAEARTAGHRA